MASKRSGARGKLSRRVFIHRLTFLGGGVVLLGCHEPAPPTQAPARAKGLTTSHRTFTSEEFATMSAACERIVPRDEDPGATDAQVPAYLDKMLQTPELSQMKDDFLTGLAALDRRAQRAFGLPFSKGTPAQQDELLTLFKDSRPGSGEAHFYELLVVLTLEGLLGDPSYGGNKDKAGWKLVGFDLVGHQAAEPAPGYDGSKHLRNPHG